MKQNNSLNKDQKNNICITNKNHFLDKKNNYQNIPISKKEENIQNKLIFPHTNLV